MRLAGLIISWWRELLELEEIAILCVCVCVSKQALSVSFWDTESWDWHEGRSRRSSGDDSCQQFLTTTTPDCSALREPCARTSCSAQTTDIQTDLLAESEVLNCTLTELKQSFHKRRTFRPSWPEWQREQMSNLTFKIRFDLQLCFLHFWNQYVHVW